MRASVDLSKFDSSDFDRGRPRIVEALWLAASFLFGSGIPGSGWRVSLLRSFGAQVGDGVVIKPSAWVKFPWRLTIGNNCWVGERAWIDNLAQVTLGDNCCISQGAYLCTGSHDWSDPAFGLVTKSIDVSSGAWICAMAVVMPGTRVGEGAVLAGGSVGAGTLLPWTVYQGNPAVARGPRTVREPVVRPT